MKLIFGLHLDDLIVPLSSDLEGGVYYCGPKKLLSVVETFLGLAGNEDNIEYLRIEHYRQALLTHKEQNSSNELPLFYENSFQADQFATSAELLNRRDELVLAGYDFNNNTNVPPRINALSQVEAIYIAGLSKDGITSFAPAGFADRFLNILKWAKKIEHPFDEIWINEPMAILPSHFQLLFKILSETGKRPHIQQLVSPPLSKGSLNDLQKFQQQLLQGSKDDISLNGDSSLLIIKAKRDNEAASYIAKLLQLNPDFRPSCLIPEKNRVLDMALMQEGFPSLGILSASLARPALQILKLAPTFLWHPIDPFKILEFVTLALKPLPDRLATAIADQVAKSPGLQGEGWYATVGKYFSDLEERESAKTVKEHRKQYDFWFERNRYRIDKTAPKADVIAMFDYLREWSYNIFEENGGKNHSLLVLSEQAKRIVELLQAVPEPELDFLSLERIVRTIYEPSPVTFQEKQVGHLPHAMHPAAFINAVDEVLWWNFVQNEPNHFFSKWHSSELEYFEKNNVKVDTPKLENERVLWQRIRPVIHAQKRLILVIPEIVEGETALPHPLLGNLEAAFGHLDNITISVSNSSSKISHSLKLPNWENLGTRQLGRPAPFLQIGEIHHPQREYETLTSLESLFYFPYQWFFKYKIKLHKSAILSVVKDNTLMGNLAHRVFEKLMQEELTQFDDKTNLDNWIETESNRLLLREGAVLLMYGREPERIAFINKLKYAAWSLLSHIRNNGWEVVDTEVNLEGHFPINIESSIPIKGIADLVLKRGNELAVVDLKWRGTSYRTNTLKNEEDLQLVLYSRLLSAEKQWAHTSYFILENGKMIARNNLAFKEITPVIPDRDFREINERILIKMEKTWQWRMDQIAKGEIEIRARQTIQEIEDKYADEGLGELLMEMLEMKGEDAKWDDYRTLVNLIN